MTLKETLMRIFNQMTASQPQVVLARHLSTSQPKICRLRAYDLHVISLERLVGWILRLGYDIRITISQGSGRLSVRWQGED